ncbi:MAG: hypothetical protein M3O61_12960, partial [Gemmatimonadota bacterium]|nr:hypothetical protein [Gemmatimonadota bacterium]
MHRKFPQRLSGDDVMPLYSHMARSPRTACSRYVGRSFFAILLSLAGVGCTEETPNPSDPDIAEMGTALRAPKAKVDARALARFDAEYRREKAASRRVFEEYLPILGSAALLDYLEGRFPECHRQAHDLGRALYALRKDVGTALRECDTRCTSACMHGVVGEAFGTTDLGSIAGTIDEFCASGAMAEIHKPGNCAHGIGHALMFTTGDAVAI